VVKSHDAFDGAYTAWNTMTELTCREFARDVVGLYKLTHSLKAPGFNP
jgi:hypothetical protein